MEQMRNKESEQERIRSRSVDLGTLAVEVPSHEARKQAKARWDQIAKPLHSLGLLEDAVTAMAGIYRTADFSIKKKALVVMCADNGIVEEGVTQTGQEVTAVVTRNFTYGHTCVCKMAQQAGVSVFPVDVGVAEALEDLGDRWPLLHKKIVPGTKNFLKAPAMTEEICCQAIRTGMDLVKEFKEQGYGIIATGEMGIGNTTTSSAVASVLLRRAPEEMTGPGSGLSKEGMQRKIQVIREGISRHGLNFMGSIKPEEGFRTLCRVGGLDLAALAGVFIGGGVYQVPIVADGFISGTAALAAEVMVPGVREYVLASHCSKEPAGGLVLEALGLKPVIRGEMCLGEGSGAVALMPLLDMAMAVYTSMSTFEEIEIESYQPL